jgi:outer membrane receptor for ferrienterochelin and colicin
VATQPINNFQDLLTGRASGVSIVASSGQVGTGSRIRVRGASSLSLNNNPLIFVDGVRVDNTQASGPATQGFGSQSISRWNDFNPDDIESLEVIKGPGGGHALRHRSRGRRDPDHHQEGRRRPSRVERDLPHGLELGARLA